MQSHAATREVSHAHERAVDLLDVALKDLCQAVGTIAIRVELGLGDPPRALRTSLRVNDGKELTCGAGANGAGRLCWPWSWTEIVTLRETGGRSESDAASPPTCHPAGVRTHGQTHTF